MKNTKHGEMLSLKTFMVLSDDKKQVDKPFLHGWKNQIPVERNGNH